jgi:putative FmdB family regulatory protein
MPTYDYECGACDHTFEVFQSITESVKRKCPVCGKKSLRRLIGAGAALLFKGSGFYKTDYRSESYSKAAAADKPAGAASKDGSAAKSSSDGTSGKSSEQTKAKSK